MVRNPGPERRGPRLRLVSAPWSSLYDLPVDAIVEEQDRFRILGLDAAFPEPAPVSYPRLIHAIDHEVPASLGSVLHGGGRPLRLKAVLLDIDQGAHVQIEHLSQVAERLCQLIDAAPIRRLGLPLLGCVHGDATPELFASVFAPCLRETRLETLYLLAGSNPGALTLDRLRTAFETQD